MAHWHLSSEQEWWSGVTLITCVQGFDAIEILLRHMFDDMVERVPTLILSLNFLMNLFDETSDPLIYLQDVHQEHSPIYMTDTAISLVENDVMPRF